MGRQLLALALLCPLASAQVTGISWFSGTWQDAMETAAARNVPILIAFIQDDEEANDRIVETIYSDKEFLELCQRVVPIIASMGTHKPVEGPDGRQVCSRFGHLTCAEHRRLEADVRALYWPKEGVTTPTHIIAKPDGTEISRLVDIHTINAYQGMVRGATSDLGKGMSHTDYTLALALLKEAANAARVGPLSTLRAHLDRLTPLVASSPLRETVLSLFKKLDEEGAQIPARATDHQVAGRFLDAGVLLREGLVALKDRPGERPLREAYAVFRVTADGKAVDALLEREARLRPQFEKLTQAEDGAKLPSTVKTYYEILGQVPGTPLAVSVRERLSNLAPAASPALKRTMDEEEANLLWREAARTAKANPERAKEIYQEIVTNFPKTKAAARASKALQ